MATRMQQRRDTAANWIANDPILAPGEFGVDTDSGEFRLGDGLSTWSQLSPFKSLEDLGGNLDDYIPLTQKGSPDGVVALDINGTINSETLSGLTDFQGIVDFSEAVVVGIDSLPTQTGNAGKYLSTDGTTASWQEAATQTPHPFTMIG